MSEEPKIKVNVWLEEYLIGPLKSRKILLKVVVQVEGELIKPEIKKTRNYYYYFAGTI